MNGSSCLFDRESHLAKLKRLQDRNAAERKKYAAALARERKTIQEEQRLEKQYFEKASLLKKITLNYSDIENAELSSEEIMSYYNAFVGTQDTWTRFSGFFYTYMLAKPNKNMEVRRLISILNCRAKKNPSGASASTNRKINEELSSIIAKKRPVEAIITKFSSYFGF